MNSYDEKRMDILRMVEEGTLSASDAASLLSALGREMQAARVDFQPELDQPPPNTEAPSQPDAPIPPETSVKPAKPGPRFFRVRVTDMNSGRTKVTVNLPIGLVHWGMRFGARFSPEMQDFDFAELKEMLETGEEGKLVDVMDEEDGEHVEIFVD